MRIEWEPTIRDDDGNEIVPDYLCEVDCELEWDNGEPAVSVNGVYRGDLDLIRSGDLLAAVLGTRIASMAEDSDFIMDKLLASDGAVWTGRGALDPEGAWRRPEL
ncbi:MAG TPA: hypothetical protein VFS39_00530 [Nitrospira sp.]|nr:hypothetical protein [Nitrospira sp.]